MNTGRRRSIFISATTAGFGEWRSWIKDILIQQEITPVEQSLLSPEAGVIKAEIERKISGVDGVICLIGPYYGTRLGLPPAEGQPTMSYTQYEWQMTTQDYKKQSLVYLVKDEFFSAGISSEVTPEDACSVHFRAWQDEFRSRLWHAPSEHHQRRVASPVELALALAKINWRQWPRE